jgi:hypothetical protein
MVYRDSGYTVKGRTRRGAWGSTKKQWSFSHRARRWPGHLLQTHVPNPIKMKEVYSNVSNVSKWRPIIHGFGCQFPLNFKRELRVIVNVSRMSSGSFVQRHTSDTD